MFLGVYVVESRRYGSQLYSLLISFFSKTSAAAVGMFPLMPGVCYYYG